MSNKNLNKNQLTISKKQSNPLTSSRPQLPQSSQSRNKKKQRLRRPTNQSKPNRKNKNESQCMHRSRTISPLRPLISIIKSAKPSRELIIRLVSALGTLKMSGKKPFLMKRQKCSLKFRREKKLPKCKRNMRWVRKSRRKCSRIFLNGNDKLSLLQISRLRRRRKDYWRSWDKGFPQK